MVDSAAMTGRADIIFALPFRALRAVVLPGLNGWEEALVSLGVRCLSGAEAGERTPDVLVGPGTTILPAPAGPRGVVLEGRGLGRRLRGSGYELRRLLALPNVEDPEVLLPVRMPVQVRYGLRRSPPASAWKRLRNRLIVPLLAAGVPPFGLTSSAGSVSRRRASLGNSISRAESPSACVRSASSRADLLPTVASQAARPAAPGRANRTFRT
jgi:hypothetical protein